MGPTKQKIFDCKALKIVPHRNAEKFVQRNPLPTDEKGALWLEFPDEGRHSRKILPTPAAFYLDTDHRISTL
jgi:hypothetical protein